MKNSLPKPFVFVLMPFSEHFTDIYELGIKEATNLAGAYCERVDEQLFDERISDRIYNQINKADVIISDMTGKNPNVFYETGYAHALGKRVILVTQNDDDIPFDLKPYQHIIYDGKIKLLRDKLKTKIDWAINHPKDNTEIFTASTQYMIQGVEVAEGAESFIIEHFDDETRNIERLFQIDIFNLSDSTIYSDQIQLSLLIDYYTGQNATLMPDNRYLHKIPIQENIYPSSHVIKKINLHIPQGIDHNILSNPGVNAEICETTEYGQLIRKMNLKLISREKFEVLTHKL